MGSLGIKDFTFWLSCFRFLFVLFFRFFPQYRDLPCLWCPAVQYPECLYRNDRNFSFCQRCGFRRLFYHSTLLRAKYRGSSLHQQSFRIYSCHSRLWAQWKTKIDPLEGAGEFYFSLFPSLNHYFQQSHGTLFVFSYGNIEKGRQRFTGPPALCSYHILRNVVIV